ncbi:MAG: hypothetical protein L6R28_03040 [Planctomycetes bacterium]|nr:hypothetical protein [Planctomycetota bacterium]
MAAEDPDRTPLLAAAPVKRPVKAGWVLVAVLVLGSPSLVAFSLFEPFLEYDDVKMVVENPISKQGLTPEALEQVARPPVGDFEGYYGQYIPLTYFTLGLQYRLVGNRPWTFRLVNLLFHLGTALLLFRIALALIPKPPAKSFAIDEMNRDYRHPDGQTWAAALGSAFFFFHPTCVESVAWAAERNNVQALFFAALAWWLWVSGGPDEQDPTRLKPPKARSYFLALLAFAAALLSKPAAVGLAPVLILTEILWIKGRRLGRDVRASTVLVFAVCAGLVAREAGHRDVLDLTGGSYRAWALTSFALAGRYIAKTIVPWPLSFCYGIETVQDAAHPWVVGTAALLLGTLLFFAWVPTGWRRLVVLGGGALMAVGPTMAPRTISYLFQDRYLYFALPMAGVLLAIAAEGIVYRLRFVRNGAARAKLLVLAGGMALTLFAAMGLQRSAVFRSDEDLFFDATLKQPESFFAHYHLARDLYRKSQRAGLDHRERMALLERARSEIHKVLKKDETVDRDRHPDWVTVNMLAGLVLFEFDEESSEAYGPLCFVVAHASEQQRNVRREAQIRLLKMAVREFERTNDRGLYKKIEAMMEELKWDPRYARDVDEMHLRIRRPLPEQSTDDF